MNHFIFKVYRDLHQSKETLILRILIIISKKVKHINIYLTIIVF